MLQVNRKCKQDNQAIQIKLGICHCVAYLCQELLASKWDVTWPIGEHK